MDEVISKDLVGVTNWQEVVIDRVKWQVVIHNPNLSLCSSIIFRSCPNVLNGKGVKKKCVCQGVCVSVCICVCVCVVSVDLCAMLKNFLP